MKDNGRRETFILKILLVTSRMWIPNTPCREAFKSFRVQTAQLNKRIQAEVNVNNLFRKERYGL
jgi:hypothetical protein